MTCTSRARTVIAGRSHSGIGPGDSGEPTAQDWADAVGTISYEIATSFGGRLPRSYFGVIYEDDPGPAAPGAEGSARPSAPPA